MSVALETFFNLCRQVIPHVFLGIYSFIYSTNLLNCHFTPGDIPGTVINQPVTREKTLQACILVNEMT